MQTLTFNRKSKDALSFIQSNDRLTGEQNAKAVCLWYMGSVYPKEVTFEELEQVSGVTPGQVSRIIRSLHKMDHRGGEGLDYVSISFDIRNTRMKLVKLSEKGLNAMTETLEDLK